MSTGSGSSPCNLLLLRYYYVCVCVCVGIEEWSSRGCVCVGKVHVMRWGRGEVCVWGAIKISHSQLV